MLRIGYEMIKWYSWITLISLGVFAKDVLHKNIAPHLQECYDNKFLYEKDNRLPHTLNTFIALIRKIEEVEDVDLQTLTVGLIHRFRQDGIVENPNVPRQPGVSPFAPLPEQHTKFTHTLYFITQRTPEIPLDILNATEKCSLHFMLSDSIDIFERGDENKVCKVANNLYRRPRSTSDRQLSKENFNMHDVETLTPEEIDVITNHKGTAADDAVDPNALYPELPPNHPKIAQLSYPRYSDCPVENGIIKTHWGPVSIGSVIAGIAAGLQPEAPRLSEVPPHNKNRQPEYLQLTVDNRWLATISGDLAEVALIQGPMVQKMKVGVDGNWNSTALPRWYFLKHNDSLEFTTAEIRGNIDGLIIADEIESLYSKIPRLRLSQILELYYGPRGLFDHSIRACNRVPLFSSISANASRMMIEQATSASFILKEDLQMATMEDDRIQEFARNAANELSTSGISYLKNDLSCQNTETGDLKDVVQLSADLTIILDTSWLFESIQPIVANLLENTKINKYNSRYTVINGKDGSIMLNTTDSIIDFGFYNKTNYKNGDNGFDFAKTLKQLQTFQETKLDDERIGNGNEKTDIILFIIYASVPIESEKDYYRQQMKWMREHVPDATMLVLTHGAKEVWLDYVSSINDVFTTTGDNEQDGFLTTVLQVVSRMRSIPQRLINTRCGANYSPSGETNSFIDYIEPNTVIYYRMHPNYFYSEDSSHYSTIKIEPSVWGALKVCKSRQPINIDSPEGDKVECTQITEKAYTASFSCNEAEHIHTCQPFYMMVIANSTVDSYPCTETMFCKYPHMIKYTVSYQSLVCTSSANINLLSIIVLIISIISMLS